MKNLIKKELCSGMWKNLRPEVKRVYALIIAAILVCGIAVTVSISLTSCEEAKAQNEESTPKVESRNHGDRLLDSGQNHEPVPVIPNAPAHGMLPK